MAREHSGHCGLGDASTGELPYAESTGVPRSPWPPVGRVTRTLAELIRARGRVQHLPTVGQLRAMAEVDGWEPCSYPLDREVNWLPSAEEMPVDLERELGRQGLCFCCRLPSGREAELVVFPSGHGFDLLGGL